MSNLFDLSAKRTQWRHQFSTFTRRHDKYFKANMIRPSIVICFSIFFCLLASLCPLSVSIHSQFFSSVSRIRNHGIRLVLMKNAPSDNWRYFVCWRIFQVRKFQPHAMLKSINNKIIAIFSMLCRCRVASHSFSHKIHRQCTRWQ